MTEKSKQSFTSMAGPKSSVQASPIGIDMLGYAFMGKAHSHALKVIPHMIYPPPAIPRLEGICGRDQSAVEEAARRYSYQTSWTDWRKMLEGTRDRVQILDICSPNDLHAEPAAAAAELGLHVICEKPLARTAEEAHNALQAVKKAGVKHMTAFNYRFVPAVRQAKLLIDSGLLGRIYHFRAVYLQEWIMPHYDVARIWRMDKSQAGSGALGDMGAHIIDLGRYLVGEMKSVSASTRTFVRDRRLPDGSGSGAVDVDDAFASVVEFENGALGTLESTRFAAGRKNHNRFEINAEKGSLVFNLERMNELQVFWVDDQPAATQGFHDVIVTEGEHPWIEHWWPHGHIIGWEHTFVHELSHFINCVVNDQPVAPIGATFDDGYRAAVVSDAILESSAARRTVDLSY